jgi:hypothetical protein
MNIFRKLFGPRRSAAAQKILKGMNLFTSAALILVQPSDFEGDDSRTDRVFVFLFGALDALLQHHSITGQEMIDILVAFLQQTFPEMTPSQIQTTVSFLCDASGRAEWVPIMRSGGQTMVDWLRGDSKAPLRLFKVVHYDIDL